MPCSSQVEGTQVGSSTHSLGFLLPSKPPHSCVSVHSMPPFDASQAMTPLQPSGTLPHLPAHSVAGSAGVHSTGGANAHLPGFSGSKPQPWPSGHSAAHSMTSPQLSFTKPQSSGSQVVLQP